MRLLLSFLVSLLWCISLAIGSDDKYIDFLNLLSNSANKLCPDKTFLLPDCNECIPGLIKGEGSSSCNKYTESSKSIRDEIKQLTDERYPKQAPSRPFGLYPYLESSEFLKRQEKFGSWLSENNATHIVDIGAYYNPIYMFLSKSHCPKSFIVIEPILDAFSGFVSCPNGQGETHILVLPITFKYYTEIKQIFPTPDAVVCIGCDSHYGPNRRYLETTFPRPFTLYLEYPSEYIHNGPYKRMGKADGEKMNYFNSYQVATDATKFTKRVMKVIEYS